MGLTLHLVLGARYLLHQAHTILLLMLPPKLNVFHQQGSMHTFALGFLRFINSRVLQLLSSGIPHAKHHANDQSTLLVFPSIPRPQKSTKLLFILLLYIASV